MWPAVPLPTAAATLAVLHQLEHSQWLSPERLLEQQLRQLDLVLRHAYASVPYYRERWRGRYAPDLPLTFKRFARLPLLTRRELQEQFEAFKSQDVPAAHGVP